MALERTQLVTVPILDARLAALEARFDARLAVFDARLNALEAKLEAKMDQKLERLRLQIIVVIVLANVASGPLGAAALNAIRHVF